MCIKRTTDPAASQHSFKAVLRQLHHSIPSQPFLDSCITAFLHSRSKAAASQHSVKAVLRQLHHSIPSQPFLESRS